MAVDVDELVQLDAKIDVLQARFVTCLERISALCRAPTRPRGALIRERLAFGEIRGFRRQAIDQALALPAPEGTKSRLLSRSLAAKSRMQEVGLPLLGRWTPARMETDPGGCAVELGALLPFILAAAAEEYETAVGHLAELIAAAPV